MAVYSKWSVCERL